MERISLNKEVSLSRIVYGMWRLGDDKNTSPNHVRAKIDASLDQGITSFDQADIYGGYEAEEILGNALSGSTKYYDTSRAHILASVDHSLRLMGIDHIDLLLIHRPDPLMDHHETGAALDEVIASGKVRSVGVSNFRHYDWELLQSAMKNQLVTNQIELSVLAHDSFVNGDVAFHQRIGTPLMAWSPLAGGALFSGDHPDIMSALSNVALQNNVDETAVAIAWLLAHPSRILPVLGTNSLDRIKGMSAALDVKMDRQTWYEIYTAALGREVA
ncbi:MAG: oxidoreductase [Rhodobacteraceae bacterium]|nr:oxidoreductase [Paracoccaceae bacterium]